MLSRRGNARTEVNLETISDQSYSKYTGRAISKNRVILCITSILLIFGIISIHIIYSYDGEKETIGHDSFEKHQEKDTQRSDRFDVDYRYLKKKKKKSRKKSMHNIEESERFAMQQRLTTFDKDGNPIGYVRVPKLRSDGQRTSDDGKLHIIFSSGCNYFQNWQSELLLSSAWMVGQRGRITRLVSGCYDKKAEKAGHTYQTFPRGKNDLLVPVHKLNRSVNEEFGLYITPAFEGAIDFPWINKPSSIDHFLKHAQSELERMGETIIAILDPDFIFLKPLSQIGSDIADIVKTKNNDGEENDPLDVVIKGRPVGQRYGIGGGWVTRLNVKLITGDENSPATKYTPSKASQHFSVGPPLILHVDDAVALANLWIKFMGPVLDQEIDILADMWAYSIAAAELGLHHTILDQYMISCHGNRGEAYEWINAWPHMGCLDPKTPSGAKIPNFIHLASNFKAPSSKIWMFHKGHVPPDILECDTPLIKESPDNLWEISENEKIKQDAWILCNTVSHLNKMLMLYKKKFCQGQFESRKLVRLIQSKTKDTHCNILKDKWCWPLCQIEDLPKDWRNIDHEYANDDIKIARE